MLQYVKLLQKRPSDKTIMIWRILFWLILIWSLYYNLIIQWDKLESNFFWIELNENTLNYIKYFFVSIWLIPLIMWITNMCMFKKKYIRIIQTIFWILLFYISSQIVEWPNLDVDVLIWILWLLPFFAWITWKCITSKCLKFGEKVTKIRI